MWFTCHSHISGEATFWAAVDLTRNPSCWPEFGIGPVESRLRKPSGRRHDVGKIRIAASPGDDGRQVVDIEQAGIDDLEPFGSFEF